LKGTAWKPKGKRIAGSFCCFHGILGGVPTAVQRLKNKKAPELCPLHGVHMWRPRALKSCE